MTITLSQSLVWDAVAGALDYRVQLLDSTGATVKDLLVEENSITAVELFTGLSAGPTYRARVRAEAGTFAGDWTSPLLDLVLQALGTPGNLRVE